MRGAATRWGSDSATWWRTGDGAAAGEVARRDGVEVIIRRRDGRIRDSDSYGNAPHLARDRKR